jgi:replicative DNA helicase
MVENKIIKLFCEEKELFTKYYKYVNISFIKSNYSNIYKIFNIINLYYNKYNNNNINKEDLIIYYNSNYLLKDSERKELETLLDNIFSEDVSNKELIIELLEEHRRRSLAGDVAKIALDVEDGRAAVADLLDLFSKFEHQEIEVSKSTPVQMALKELYDTQVDTPGLRWRLKFLNQSLGSLRKGDFGFLFARPETGKTTFLASEVSHMATQTEGDILWFCNEEQGNKVGIRTFQAALGVDTQTLWDDIDRHQALYDTKIGNRIKIFYDDDANRASRIEQIIKEHNPALIIFDQLDKVKGFKAERKDLELAAGYQWAREISKQYAPVIGVSQASGEAEGKLWLSMDMIDGSKTGKAAEADWILGIGKDSDNTSRSRYFSICKNKLLGDKDTLPDLRHGSGQVLIRPEVARYEDIG